MNAKSLFPLVRLIVALLLIAGIAVGVAASMVQHMELMKIIHDLGMPYGGIGALVVIGATIGCLGLVLVWLGQLAVAAVSVQLRQSGQVTGHQ